MRAIVSKWLEEMFGDSSKSLAQNGGQKCVEIRESHCYEMAGRNAWRCVKTIGSKLLQELLGNS